MATGNKFTTPSLFTSFFSSDSPTQVGVSYKKDNKGCLFDGKYIKLRHSVGPHGNLQGKYNMKSGEFIGTVANSVAAVNFTNNNAGTTVGLGVRNKSVSLHHEAYVSKSGNHVHSTLTGSYRPFKSDELVLSAQGNPTKLQNSTFTVSHVPSFLPKQTFWETALNHTGFQASGKYTESATADVTATVLATPIPQVTFGVHAKGSFDINNRKGCMNSIKYGVDCKPTEDDQVELRTDGLSHSAKLVHKFSPCMTGIIGTSFMDMNYAPSFGFGLNLEV